MFKPSTNSQIMGLFMSTTLEAAVHLGTDYLQNLQAFRNQPDQTMQQLFNVCQRLIHNQREITGLTKIDCGSHPWQKTTLLCDRAVSPTPCCVLGNSKNQRELQRSGKNRLYGSPLLHNTKNWVALTENQWNSSGRFSQDSLHCRFSDKF